MSQRQILFWSAVAGLIASVVAIVSFLTGFPSIPAAFEREAEPASESVNEFDVSLDVINADHERVFVLDAPVAHGAGNTFLADRVLVRYYGDDKGVYLLQCRDDRQCRSRRMSELSFVQPHFAAYAPGEVLVFGQQDYGGAPDARLDDSSKPFGALLDEANGGAVYDLVRVDLRTRVISNSMVMVRRCVYNGLAGRMDSATRAADGLWRFEIKGNCGSVYFSDREAQTQMAEGLFGRFEILGRFDGDGEFATSNITASSMRDE